MRDLNLNPRFVEYARCQRSTPDEQIAKDRIKWPGGSMAGFVIWNMYRIRDFMNETRVCCVICHQDEYDQWLHNWVTKKLKRGRETVTEAR
jgi:hypothetical protein